VPSSGDEGTIIVHFYYGKVSALEFFGLARSREIARWHFDALAPRVSVIGERLLSMQVGRSTLCTFEQLFSLHESRRTT
jgi:hypothetical protein